MSLQTLKFSDIVINKYNYPSKQAIPLNSVNTNNIVTSYSIKQMMMVLNILLAIYMMLI